MSNANDGLTTVYKTNGKTLRVNDHMIKLLKSGDKTLAGLSLEAPSKK